MYIYIYIYAYIHHLYYSVGSSSLTRCAPRKLRAHGAAAMAVTR